MDYILIAVAAFVGGFFGAYFSVRPAKMARLVKGVAKKIPVAEKIVKPDTETLAKAWMYEPKEVDIWN